MSKNNWKYVQRFDSFNCGLVTNCDRPAKPNSPDGLDPMEALKHLNIDSLIKAIEWNTTLSGWFPESKAGYYYMPKILQEQVILPSKKTMPTQIFYVTSQNYAFFRKENFFSYINNIGFQTFNRVEIDYSIPKYMTNWLEQAKGYFKILNQDTKLKYPFVGWHPKQHRGENRRLVDGLVFTEEQYVNEFFKEI